MELTQTRATRSSRDRVARSRGGGAPAPNVGRAAARTWPGVAAAESLRIGIVGCGYWGAKHARVFSSLRDVGQVALIEPNAHSLQALSAAYPEAPTYASLAAALPNVDAVVIATPPGTHTDLAIQALRGGKHVLVEKPLATTSAEARLIVEEARRADRVLMVGHTFEFNPAVQELRQRVDQGELGEVYYIHSSRFNVDLYRRDVNVIWDLAPHDISIMNYLLRAVPTTVTAWGSSNGHIDVAYIRLDYGAIGVTGYVHVSWLDPRKTRQITVVGRNKVAAYNDMATDDRLRIYERTAEMPEPTAAGPGWPPSYRYGDSIALQVDSKEPLALEDQHFVDRIRGMTSPEADGFDGLAVVATLEAAERSMRAGHPVELELSRNVFIPDAQVLASLAVAGA
jgi:predicted dehydrogenase